LKAKSIIFVVNFAILSTIVYWLKENISLSKLITQFKVIPLEGPVVVVLLNISVIFVYGVRLSMLIRARQLPSTAIVTIGFGMNGILPFRLGELVKLAYARQLFAITTPRLITATALEKLMDLSALVMLGIVASQIAVVPYMRNDIAVSAFLAGGLILGLVLAYQILTRWKSPSRQLQVWTADALDALTRLKDSGRVLRLALMTCFIWGATVFSVYWIFHIVFPQFSFSDAGLLTVVIALATAVPSAPAGLGVIEAAIIAYLYQALQAEPNQALAIALVFHASIVLPQIIATAFILIFASLRQWKAA
jgi:glycosyltransferase 2 family protein